MYHFKNKNVEMSVNDPKKQTFYSKKGGTIGGISIVSHKVKVLTHPLNGNMFQEKKSPLSLTK